MRITLVCVGILGNFAWACSDAARRPIGSTCQDSEECASGLCYEQTCIEPTADEDQDGLTNTVELSLGSDPKQGDTDGDGVADRDELDSDLELLDSDGDSRPDILESANDDADMDCVADEADPEDTSPVEGTRSDLVSAHCPQAGLCVGAALAVTCPDGLDSPVCDFSGVPGYAPVDVTCNGVDDDCDGQVDDEGQCGAFPNGCWAISPRVDGTYKIDFDGIGPELPVDVYCLFSVELGDWMRLDAKVSPLTGRLVLTEPREYLLRKGNAWFRSPFTTSAWDWKTGANAPGLWMYVAPSGAVGGFDCEAKAEGSPQIGVGCAGARVLQAQSGDSATGTATVCDSAGGVFGSACESDVEIYVRYRGCRPDDGQMLSDGGFSGFSTGMPCWFAVTNGVPMANFQFDSDDIPPGGTPPSLKGQNPRLNNIAREIEVGQSRFPFLAGRSYSLGFWAKSKTTRTILVSVQQKNILQPMLSNTVTIGTEWARYNVDFNATESTWDGLLSFGFGAVSTEPVWLDDVVLLDLGAAPTSPCDPPAGNFVANGGFAGAEHACWELVAADGISVSSLDDTSTFPTADTPPSLRVSHAPGTDNLPDVTLTQRGLTLPANRHMRLSFWLKAMMPRIVSFALIGGPLPPIVLTDVDATWKQFSYEFESGLGVTAGSVQFQFGQHNGDNIWIDGVMIQDLGPSGFSP